MKSFYNRLFFLFLFIVTFFSGCSSSVPEVNHAIASVVFEYEDYDSFPQKRLALIIDSQSDIHRAQRLSVICLDNNYMWTSDNLVKFQNNKKTYAGYTNFVMPENKNVPQGNYKIIYENADNQNIEVEIKIKYDENISSYKAEKCENSFKDKSSKLKIGIYDRENKLLYFGDKKNELSSKENILKSYRTASYYRNVWSTQNDGILCIMPKEYISEETNASENN